MPTRATGTTLVLVIAAVAALALAPAKTDAAELIYPGAACQPSPSDNVDPDISHSAYGTYNIDPTYARGVNFPISRQNVSNITGLNTSYIRVYDNSATRGFSCTIYSMSSSGSLQDSATNVTSNLYTGATSLAITGISVSAAYGYYVAYCSIPNDYSKVNSYRIIEP